MTRPQDSRIRNAGMSRRGLLRGFATAGLAPGMAWAADRPYSIVVLPDEQYLAYGGPLYSQITTWVVENTASTAPDGESWNIIGVIGVGDCVDATSASENVGTCLLTRTAYQILDDAGIPFIVAPGNHDYVLGTPLTSRLLGPNFTSGGFFSPSVRARRPYYGGSYDEDAGLARPDASGANWWVTFQAESRKILLIALEFCPRDAVVSWAKRVHDAMPNTECIVITHSFLTDTGIQGDRKLTFGPQNYGFLAGSASFPTHPGYGFSGQELWGAVEGQATIPLKMWSNLTAIISGHYVYSGSVPASRHYRRTPVESSSARHQVVQQLYCNCQDLDAANDSNGAGLCILRFSPARSSLSTYWFSRKSSRWSADSVAFSVAVAALERDISYGGIAAGTEEPKVSVVLNAASFMSGMTEGSWITLFGTNLSLGGARGWRSEDFVGGRLPVELDNVRVEIDGVSAAIAYISPGQLNVLAPAIGHLGTIGIEVIVAGRRSNRVSAVLERHSPGIFQWGSELAVATHLDSSPASRSESVAGATPAVRGETIVLWTTGLGKADPPVTPDRISPVPARVIDPVLVRFDGPGGRVPAEAYLTAGFAGLYQVAVRIPDAVSPGDIPVTVEIGNAVSKSAVLPVRI